MSVSKTPGVGVVSVFAMEASPGAPTPRPLSLTVQNGGRAGIWRMQFLWALFPPIRVLREFSPILEYPRTSEPFKTGIESCESSGYLCKTQH